MRAKLAKNESHPRAKPASAHNELDAVLAGDDTAWRTFVRRYDRQLRNVVRHATEAIRPLRDDQVDDVLGDFWLRVVANDFRMLRAFDPTRERAALLTWLTFQVANVAHEHLQKVRDELLTVPLHEAGQLPDETIVARVALKGESEGAEAERALIHDLAEFLVQITLDGKLEDSEPTGGDA